MKMDNPNTGLFEFRQENLANISEPFSNLNPPDSGNFSEIVFIVKVE